MRWYLPAFVVVLFGCAGHSAAGARAASCGLAGSGGEAPVLALPLTGPLAEPRAEVSGLAWYGDRLVLLPQYPEDLVEGTNPALFALSRAEIAAAISACGRGAPLDPRAVPLSMPDLRALVPGYEGLEAIAFLGDRVYFTVESTGPVAPGAYLAAGHVEEGLTRVVIDSLAPLRIEGRSRVRNMGEEAIVVLHDTLLLVLHEANGRLEGAPAPRALRFGRDLAPRGEPPFPSIPFRVTDATTAGADGRFWVINYHYPGDRDLEEEDLLAVRVGRGATPALSPAVERLLELRVDAGGIRLSGRPPVHLRLDLAGGARNWEGIARMGEAGVLLVTDEHPTTLLGFVALPPGPR